VNFKNFLRLCAKNEYKECNMNSIQNTKSSLDNCYIGYVYHVMHTNKKRSSFSWEVTLVQSPYNT